MYLRFINPSIQKSVFEMKIRQEKIILNCIAPAKIAAHVPAHVTTKTTNKDKNTSLFSVHVNYHYESDSYHN